MARQKDPKALRARAEALLAEAEKIENAKFIELGKLVLKLYEKNELKDEQLKDLIEKLS